MTILIFSQRHISEAQGFSQKIVSDCPQLVVDQDFGPLLTHRGVKRVGDGGLGVTEPGFPGSMSTCPHSLKHGKLMEFIEH